MPKVPVDRHEQVVEKYKSQYILKVCGQELYFISEDYPLCQVGVFVGTFHSVGVIVIFHLER